MPADAELQGGRDWELRRLTLPYHGRGLDVRSTRERQARYGVAVSCAYISLVFLLLLLEFGSVVVVVREHLAQSSVPRRPTIGS